MATIATTTDQLNDIYLANKESFISDPFKGSFHNLLWQLIVNRVGENETQTFYDVYHEGEHILARVFADQPGFINTGICFKGLSEKAAQQVCERLNTDIFGQDAKESENIVSSSFKSQIGTEEFLK